MTVGREHMPGNHGADVHSDIVIAELTRAVVREETQAAVHESFTLPLLFLTVVLGGSLRLGEAPRLSFHSPSLMALVLAVMLLAVLYRAGALVPDALVHPRRTALEKVSGLIVLATLFAAAAQVFSIVTPDAGLLAFAFNVVFLVLLGNTLAARPDRSRLLTSLLIIFGAAFVMKFVVLSAIYAPGSGLTKRVVMALFEGITLGTLAFAPPSPATGYVAFGTIALFLIGVAWLPRPPLAPLHPEFRERLPAGGSPASAHLSSSALAPRPGPDPDDP
jgi:hypothetical protein